MCFCERRVSLLNVMSAVAWAVGGLVILIGIVTRIYGLPAVGLWVAGWGGVLLLRERHKRIEERERAAFDLGRKVGTEEGAEVTSIRS